MKSHTDLLNTLIDALYAAPPSPEIHRYQILAAEIRGRMGGSDPEPERAGDDGWIKNTGKNPQCAIAKVKFRDGSEDTYPNPIGYDWTITNSNGDITHYKPL